ncbi:MAG TPA: Hsp70 family protein [Polyangiaceae bacterium]|nr:Hsp70 family protein [Polyangiaceae bacterium]
MAVVGIDLGTTNTVVAAVRGGRVHVLADEQGRRLLPSIVSFHPSGDVLVGYPAKERRVVDAKNTIASVKRLIGKAWDTDEIKRARQRFAFDFKEGVGQGPLIVVRGQEYTLPEISAFVLRRAKQIAEHALDETVDRAVITVPANFNELQRAATKVAGRIAGLDILRIINEPTAAALAYGLGRSTKERIAIYDFGGGTFDCTLLDLSGSVFEVLATAGDSFLGGDDIDLAISERMADAFLRAHRYDARAHPQTFERLREAAETLKIALSTQTRAQVKLREIAFGVGGAHLELDFGMTRDELDALAAPLVERTFAVCQEAMSMARLPVNAFDKTILVGGTTRMALVRRRVEHFFGTPPLDRVNPEEVVGIGAAIQAAALTEAARRQNIPPPPLVAASARRSTASTTDREEDEITVSTSVPAEIAALHRSRPLPEAPPLNLDRSRPATHRPYGEAAKTGQASAPAPVDRGRTVSSRPPVEVLPTSAPAPADRGRSVSSRPPGEFLPASAPSPAVGGRSVSSRPPVEAASAPVLVDVTPRALVVETVGGWCDVVVQRNAKIPCERSRAFATSSDGQTLVRVRVAQGEDPYFRNNTFLGEVELTGLRAAPRGVVTIQVRFEVDESGTLQVFATDVATGREAHALLQLVGIAGVQSVAEMRVRHVAAQVL